MKIRSSQIIIMGITALIYVLSMRCGNIYNPSKTVQRSRISEDDAIAIAEMFIIDNHYTNTPSLLSRVVLEDSEESEDIDEIMRARRGSLDGKAISAWFSEDRWFVLFRRKNNDDMCRCVTMDSIGLSVRMEPWDMQLNSITQDEKKVNESSELVVVAKLIDKQSCPHSGTIHFGLVMKYRVIDIVAGQYPYDLLLAAHGAPEIPREEYSENSGTLREFMVGDTHRMKLRKVEDMNDYSFSVIDNYGDISLPRYLCITVDLVE